MATSGYLLIKIKPISPILTCYIYKYTCMFLVFKSNGFKLEYMMTFYFVYHACRRHHKKSGLFLVGRQFDKSGNLKQWWDDDVIAKFKDQAKCIIEQYGNYTVPEVGINVGNKSITLRKLCIVIHIVKISISPKQKPPFLFFS